MTVVQDTCLRDTFNVHFQVAREKKNLKTEEEARGRKGKQMLVWKSVKWATTPPYPMQGTGETEWLTQGLLKLHSLYMQNSICMHRGT